MTTRTAWLLIAAHLTCVIALCWLIRDMRAEHKFTVRLNTAVHQALCDQRDAVDQLVSVNGKLTSLVTRIEKENIHE